MRNIYKIGVSDQKLTIIQQNLKRRLFKQALILTPIWNPIRRKISA